MGYQWQLLNANANIPSADGVACCRHPNGYRFMFGGVYTSTTSALYRSHDDDPDDWTFLGNLNIPPRHLSNLVPHSDGRIYIRGGDHRDSDSQKDLCSIDGEGGDLIVHETVCPSGPRIGVHVVSIGDYLYEIGGQSSITGPGVYYTDLWRWHPTSGYEVLRDDDTWGAGGTPKQMPWGTRGFYSGWAQNGGKIYLVGGSEYEMGPFTRYSKHDVFSFEIGQDGLPIIKLINPRHPWNRLIWPTLAYWDNNLWVICGADMTLGSGSNADIRSVWRSPDEGKTWIQEPDFPGTKRHAAGSIVGPNYIDIGTGSHYGKDLYRLIKSLINYGAPANSTTGWSGTMRTIIDTAYELPVGAKVKAIGIHLFNSHSVLPKIAKRNSITNFDFVYSGQQENHPGGGDHFFELDDAFVVPGTGYFIGVSAAFPASPPEAFCSSGSRAHAPGDLTGDGVTLNHMTDGAICMRWIEEE